jgi:hypothetical protein
MHCPIQVAVFAARRKQSCCTFAIDLRQVVGKLGAAIVGGTSFDRPATECVTSE